MKTIEQQLEEEITRDNCLTCHKKYYDDVSGFMRCGVTEELVGSGDEYCKLIK